ncbi:MAG: ATP12 family protein, partial [Parvularculaceae bacterium]
MKRVGDRPMDRPEQVVKKFYDSVSFDQTPDGYQLLLDRRGAKTPAKKSLIAPTKKMIAAIISEWQGQGETLDFATMPMSQRQMVFLDQATSEAPRWRSVVVGYIQS